MCCLAIFLAGNIPLAVSTGSLEFGEGDEAGKLCWIVADLDDMYGHLTVAKRWGLLCII